MFTLPGLREVGRRQPVDRGRPLREVDDDLDGVDIVHPAVGGRHESVGRLAGPEPHAAPAGGDSLAARLLRFAVFVRTDGETCVRPPAVGGIPFTEQK